MLRFAVKVKGMFTNFDVYIAIMLGTEPNSGLNHQRTFNPMNVPYSLNPQQSAVTNHDLISSYN
jgi:hypothetical protein